MSSGDRDRERLSNCFRVPHRFVLPVVDGYKSSLERFTAHPSSREPSALALSATMAPSHAAAPRQACCAAEAVEAASESFALFKTRGAQLQAPAMALTRAGAHVSACEQVFVANARFARRLAARDCGLRCGKGLLRPSGSGSHKGSECVSRSQGCLVWTLQ